MSSYQQTSVSSLFTRDQFKTVSGLIRKRNAKGLRAYLRSIAVDLEKKGAMADYIFYALCYTYGIETAGSQD